MDFAKLVTDYLNQRTEGDPSFIVSEEALAFVDIMRADDMDRRASNVETQTSADARGEPTNEEITSEVLSDPTTEDHPDADSIPFTSEPEQDTEPVAPISRVAPEDPDATGSFSEAGQDTEPAEIFSSQDSPELPPLNSPQTPPELPSQPSPIFTEDGPQAATNDALREEGVRVEENSGLRSETTTIAPESMPDFDALLRQFDSEYKAPDPPAGDADLIPEADEIPDDEPLQNTTEFAESMMSEILSTHLSYDRRGA